MLTKEDKKEINQILKDRNIQGKSRVFDFINTGASKEAVLDLIQQIANEQLANQKPVLALADNPGDYTVFGSKLITQNAKDDMDTLMRLPFVYGGALMPDGHRVAENSAPVGSVIVSDCIIPDIVGNDVSCSVFFTTTDIDVDDDWFEANIQSLKYVLRNKAFFGLEINPDPIVFNEPFFNENIGLETGFGGSIYAMVRKIARNQFGTSGDGNHFLEWGTTNVVYNKKRFVAGSNKLAILSHFGSRNVGATIANAYIEMAKDNWQMPKGMHSAPLDFDSPDGRDYWRLMTWAGKFAEAGHRWLHKHLLEELQERIKLNITAAGSIYSRHNFAWETPDGIVHRKGATPAGYNEYGIIPATMGDKTQIVAGLGNKDSFDSASHGAGRTHSRGQALKEFSNTKDYVQKEYGVELIGGGEDEDPRAYKKIEAVMKEQQDCVTTIGVFEPRIVRMAEPRFTWR